MRLPVNQFRITSHYGMRTLQGKEQFHDGIDFVSNENSNVYSPFDGICSYDMDNYEEAKRWTDNHMSGGNMVIVDYVIDNLLYHMRFLHLNPNFISQGQGIPEGVRIGNYADVGISYGAHLHNDLYSEDWKKLNIEEFYTKLGLL